MPQYRQIHQREMAANIEAKISVAIDIYSKCAICQEFIDLNEAFAVPPVGTCYTWIVCAYILPLWAKTKPAPLVGEISLSMKRMVS